MIPSSIKNRMKKMIASQPTHGWFGNYTIWDDAKKKCTGYDESSILDKVKTALLKVKSGEAVYERDSVVFDKLEYSNVLLEAYLKIASENNNILNIVDFGGSLGSSYFQYKSLLKDLSGIKWNIVEQKHFVDCGKKYFEDSTLQFYYTIEDALKMNKAKVLLLSSVVQYFEKPYALIEKCLTFDFDYVIVDRTGFIENENERITIQIVPEAIYKASYPAWFLNEEKFVNAFISKYEMLNGFLSEQSKPLVIQGGSQVYWKGFIFKKRA